MAPRERAYSAHLLVGQRFVSRPVIYWGVLKAIDAAISGLGVGCGKLKRTGSVGVQA